MRGNGIMTIGQIIRRKQEELRHHRVMASIISHELATMPEEIVEDDNPFDEDMPEVNE